MTTRVQTWGNSLALRIPKALASEAHLREGTPVELSLEEGRLIVSVGRRPRRPLKDLIAQITDENIHAPVDWGPPVGKEIW